jgi:hypothetical protein
MGILQLVVLKLDLGPKGHHGCISEKCQLLSGLSSRHGDFAGGEWLTNLNDNKRWSFAQIADLIESVPVGLWRDECFESGRQPE